MTKVVLGTIVSLILILIAVPVAITVQHRPISGENTTPPPNIIEVALAGEHPLQRWIGNQGSCPYFDFTGNIRGGTESVSLKFFWKLGDSGFVFSSLTLDKIRVKFDPEATVPTIKFHWTKADWPEIRNPQDIMDRLVINAVVTIKENEWPSFNL